MRPNPICIENDPSAGEPSPHRPRIIRGLDELDWSWSKLKLRRFHRFHFHKLSHDVFSFSLFPPIPHIPPMPKFL